MPDCGGFGRLTLERKKLSISYDVNISSIALGLLSLRPMTIVNIQKLREQYDVIEIHTRNLRSLNITAKNYGPI